MKIPLLKRDRPIAYLQKPRNNERIEFESFLRRAIVKNLNMACIIFLLHYDGIALQSFMVLESSVAL